MVDQKPPRLVAGELETLQALLQFQRESFVRKVAGVDDERARQRFVASATTLIWLARHLDWAENLWIVHRFAGAEIGGADDVVGPDDTVLGMLERYRATWARVDAIVSRASLDDLCRQTDGASPVNLRWVLMHLLEETARHAGHADILREMIDDSTGR